VTLTCNIDDDAYQWEIDNPKYLPGQTQDILLISGPVVVKGPFKFYAISTPYSGNKAVLEFTVLMGIANTISCKGKLKKVGQKQTINIDIAGMLFRVIAMSCISFFEVLSYYNTCK